MVNDFFLGFAGHAHTMNELEIELNNFTGGINTGSNKQLAEFLFRTLKFKIPTDHRNRPLVNKPNEDWPEGVPQVNKGALVKLVARNKKQKQFLELVGEYNNISQTMSKTLDKFYACITETNVPSKHLTL